jgi:hypothetical protein
MNRLVIAAATVLAFLPRLIVAEDHTGALKERILETWRTREAKTSRFRVTWDATTLKPKGASNGWEGGLLDRDQITSHPRERFAAEGNKFAYRFHTVGSTNRTAGKTDWIITNGETATSYTLSTDGSRGSGRFLPDAKFTELGIVTLWPIVSLYRPITFLESQQATDLTIDAGPIGVDGVDCHKVSFSASNRHYDLYITADAGKLPILTRVFRDRERNHAIQVIRTTFVQDVIETPTLRGWKVDSVSPYTNSLYLSISAKTKTTDFQDDFPEDEFDPLAFPAGTLVFKAIDNTRDDVRVQGSDGQLTPYVPDPAL